MRRLLAFLLRLVCLCCRDFCIPMQVSAGDDIAERAKKLHFSSIVLDTHDDTTQRFFSKDFDIGKRNPGRAHRHSAHARRRNERNFLFHLD